MKQKTATTEQKNELAFKKKALEVTFSQIDKEYGKGAVMLLGESPNPQIDVVPTGSLLLDQAIGVGGLPKGRAPGSFGEGDRCGHQGGRDKLERSVSECLELELFAVRLHWVFTCCVAIAVSAAIKIAICT